MLKYLSLCLIFLSGCSLISINEGPKHEKVRLRYVSITRLEDGQEYEMKIRGDQVVGLLDHQNETCIVYLGQDPNPTPILAKIKCHELYIELVRD